MNSDLSDNVNLNAFYLGLTPNPALSSDFQDKYNTPLFIPTEHHMKTRQLYLLIHFY